MKSAIFASVLAFGVLDKTSAQQIHMRDPIVSKSVFSLTQTQNQTRDSVYLLVPPPKMVYETSHPLWSRTEKAVAKMDIFLDPFFSTLDGTSSSFMTKGLHQYRFRQIGAQNGWNAQWTSLKTPNSKEGSLTLGYSSLLKNTPREMFHLDAGIQSRRNSGGLAIVNQTRSDVGLILQLRMTTK